MKLNDKVMTPDGKGLVHQSANDWVIVKFKDKPPKSFKKEDCTLV